VVYIQRFSTELKQLPRYSKCNSSAQRSRMKQADRINRRIRIKRWKLEPHCSINDDVNRRQAVLALTVIGIQRGRAI